MFFSIRKFVSGMKEIESIPERRARKLCKIVVLWVGINISRVTLYHLRRRAKSDEEKAKEKKKK